MSGAVARASLHFGLGPIGLGILETGVRRGVLAPVAVVDLDREAARARLAERALVIPVEATVAKCGEPPPGTVAVHAAASRASDAARQVRALVEAGLAVVSTCEELAFPTGSNGAVRAELDAAARRRGVAVIATGVNPGMVMDSLVVHLAGVMTRLERVRVERRVDTATRREPLRRKTGLGLEPAEFAARARARTIGHVGLRESCAMLAAALGWTIDGVDETIEPALRAGGVAGLHQTARVTVDGVDRIELDLWMVDGVSEPGDRIVLAGEPPLDVRIPGGIAGDEATVGAVLNQVAAIDRLPPGFHTLIDVSDCGGRAAGRAATYAAAHGAIRAASRGHS